MKTIPVILFFAILIGVMSCGPKDIGFEYDLTRNLDRAAQRQLWEVNDHLFRKKLDPEFDVSLDTILEMERYRVLCFSEILEYGSWHYTNSAKVFDFSGDSLVLLSADNPEHTGIEGDTELLYPDRINGHPTEIVDFTGDGVPEIIFLSTGLVRTTQEDEYSLFQYKTEEKKLKSMGISVKGNTQIATCESPYGTLVEMKSIPAKDGGLPILRIVEMDVICEQEGKTFLRETRVREYRWDKEIMGMKQIQGE